MQTTEGHGRLQVGAARASITGTAHYGLGGPGRRKARGVRDDVFVRALAVSDGYLTVVLITADVRGVPSDLVAELRADLRRRVSVNDLQAIIGATAVVSGPDLLHEGRGCSRAFQQFFIERVAEVTLCAINNLQPASLVAACAEMPASVVGETLATESAPLFALSAAAPNGMTIATLSVVGCCPSVLGAGNTQVSADYLATFHQAVEAARGGISLVLPGAVGDQTARALGEGPAAAQQAGDALATPLLNALGREQPMASHRLIVERCRADLQPGSTLRGRRLWWHSLAQGSRGRVRADVRALTIGDAQLLMVPGAPTQAAVNQVRERMTTPTGAVVGCVDGMWGLLAPPEQPSDAEVDVWPTFLAPSAWGVLRDTLPTV